MAASEGLASLRAQWQESALLRLGGWVILCILIVYGLALLSDYRSQIGSEYAKAEEKIARLHAIARQVEWPRRAQQARAKRSLQEKQLWVVENRGLASAAIQSWLNEALRKSGVGSGRIQVETARDVAGFDRLWQVRAQVKGVFENSAVIDLLNNIENNPKITVVESLDVVPGRRNTFSLEIKAFFLPAGAE